MFTGIVEHIGQVQELCQLDNTEAGGNGWSLTVTDARPVLVDAKCGDSMSVNGVCLTITELDQESFKVGLAPETLRKTNLGDLKVGDGVNLERSMRADTRFGGHFVQGHVDGTATVLSMTPDGNSLEIRLSLPRELLRLIVPKGYVALDGTSLTVIEVNDQEGWFSLMLVAYTQSRVILPRKKPGDRVNLELDVLGKYVDRMLANRS